jgi:hypothetical protein
MYDTDSYRRMCYSDTHGERCLTIPFPSQRILEQILNTGNSDLIVISFHYVDVWRDSAQILVRLSIAYISGAQYLLYLARYE